MPKALDLTNQKFGKLTAIKKEKSQAGKTYWLCECECGQQKIVQTTHLRNGSIKSCGCLREEKASHLVVAFRRRVKLSLVEGFEHKCACCGLIDDATLYDFHHLIPEEKSFGIGSSSTTHSHKAYADEAKKCVMLCANCHRRVENQLIDLDNYDLIYFNEDKFYQTWQELSK